MSIAAGHPVQSPSASAEFANPQRVTIRGYSDDAMEPFLTRDDKYLFFNNSNDPQVNTKSSLGRAHRRLDFPVQRRNRRRQHRST
jgi:hypothetical protein